tara:strand:+ start:4006 stop:4395 length:390 start_codon:yes stop_codon:yes gene_type:complete
MWKKTLKKVDYDTVKIVEDKIVEDFKVVVESIEGIKKRHSEIQSAVEEYAKLMLQFDEDLVTLTQLTDRIYDLDDGTTEDPSFDSIRSFKFNTFDDYVIEAFKSFREMAKPAKKIATEALDVESSAFGI